MVHTRPTPACAPSHLMFVGHVPQVLAAGAAPPLISFLGEGLVSCAARARARVALPHDLSQRTMQLHMWLPFTFNAAPLTPVT